MRISACGIDGLVAVFQLVVGLVPLSQAHKNLNSLVDSWLRHLNGLETPVIIIIMIIMEVTIIIMVVTKLLLLIIRIIIIIAVIIIILIILLVNKVNYLILSYIRAYFIY